MDLRAESTLPRRGEQTSSRTLGAMCVDGWPTLSESQNSGCGSTGERPAACDARLVTHGLWPASCGARFVAWASRPLERGHLARAFLAGAGRSRDSGRDAHVTSRGMAILAAQCRLEASATSEIRTLRLRLLTCVVHPGAPNRLGRARISRRTSRHTPTVAKPSSQIAASCCGGPRLLDENMSMGRDIAANNTPCPATLSSLPGR